jgi:hypothetical protein
VIDRADDLKSNIQVSSAAEKNYYGTGRGAKNQANFFLAGS